MKYARKKFLILKYLEYLHEFLYFVKDYTYNRLIKNKSLKR